MKFFIAVATFAISSITMACTNFTGTYNFGSEVGNYQIVQNKCQSITLVGPNSSSFVVADGAYHVTLKEDIMINGEKVGVWSIEHRASFSQTELFLDSKFHLEFGEDTDNEEVISTNTLMPNGDLKVISTSSKDNVAKTIIATKVN